MIDSFPLVSVLMTSYNNERFIDEAIESVYLSTYTNFELIIVDDCSKDNSVMIARRWEEKDSRINVYVNKQNLGDYPNRNRAASYAKGKYLKYVDCDDKISKTCLEIMVSEMEMHPEAGLGLCTANETDIKELSPLQAYNDINGILEYYGPTGSIISRKHFYEIGKFKELVTVSDWDMWHRMAARWPIISFPSSLVLWRDHPDNTLKSVSHKIGVIKYYLQTKEEIFKSVNCPLTYNESREKLKKYNIEIFKYAFRTTVQKGNIYFLLLYFRHNFIFLLKRSYK